MPYRTTAIITPGRNHLSMISQNLIQRSSRIISGLASAYDIFTTPVTGLEEDFATVEADEVLVIDGAETTTLGALFNLRSSKHFISNDFTRVAFSASSFAFSKSSVSFSSFNL